VLDRNPTVRAARFSWQAALEKAPQAVSLPDPMVQFRQFRSDIGAPDSRVRLETMVTQEIPFPARLAAEGDAAAKDAAMARVRYDMALRDAVVEAREAFLEVLYLDRAGEALRASRAVLARYAALAAGDLATGRTRLPEEFRAQTFLAQAGYDLVVLEDLRRAAEQRLRGLAALPPESALGPFVPDAPAPVALSYEDLLRLAEERSQEVAMAGLALERARAEERAAGWEFAPTFTVGAEWMRNDMQDPAAGSFRNSRTAIVGLTVPIWVGSKSARVREAGAEVSAAGASRAAEVERVRTSVAERFFRVRNAERLVTLYDGTLLPQAEKSARLAEALYREAKASLSGMLETEIALQNFRMARARAEADQGQALARLEQVVGATVTAPPAPPAPPAAEERP
jgi:outer membrane protein TolC